MPHVAAAFAACRRAFERMVWWVGPCRHGPGRALAFWLLVLHGTTSAGAMDHYAGTVPPPSPVAFTYRLQDSNKQARVLESGAGVQLAGLPITFCGCWKCWSTTWRRLPSGAVMTAGRSRLRLRTVAAAGSEPPRLIMWAHDRWV